MMYGVDMIASEHVATKTGLIKREKEAKVKLQAR